MTDAARMLIMDKQLNVLGRVIGQALHTQNTDEAQTGFVLMLFDPLDQEVASYISNATRPQMIVALRNLLGHLENQANRIIAPDAETP